MKARHVLRLAQGTQTSDAHVGATWPPAFVCESRVLTLRLTESIGKMLDICSELRKSCMKSVPPDKLHAVLMVYVVVVVWLAQQEHLLSI